MLMSSLHAFCKGRERNRRVKTCSAVSLAAAMQGNGGGNASIATDSPNLNSPMAVEIPLMRLQKATDDQDTIFNSNLTSLAELILP